MTLASSGHGFGTHRPFRPDIRQPLWQPGPPAKAWARSEPARHGFLRNIAGNGAPLRPVRRKPGDHASSVHERDLRACGLSFFRTRVEEETRIAAREIFLQHRLVNAPRSKSKVQIS
jgi:hypothetical protein